ncbi:MAG: alpha/beta fold hydrolase [Paracoccaceae bacterium]
MSEPLVLIPDMMCDARLFAPQIVAFSRERPVHVALITGAQTIERIAEQVLANAPPRFALAGHCLGGIVAIEIMRRDAQRVTRLALLDTNAQSETPDAAAAREPQIVRAKAGQLEDVMRDAILQDYLAPGPRRAEILDLIIQMALDLGPEVFVRQSRALQRRPDQQKTLRKLQLPTLILCGERDQVTPLRHHEFIADLAPNATLQIVLNSGHLPTLEQPGLTTKLLQNWLRAPLVLR